MCIRDRPCTAQLVEEIVCKVKERMECRSVDRELFSNDVGELLEWTEWNGGSCATTRQHRQSANSDDEWRDDGRQQVTQRGPHLLVRQSEAAVRDVERIRQHVADRTMSKVARASSGEVETSSSERLADNDEEGENASSAQPSSSHDAITAVVDEGLQQHLSTIVDSLTSSLGSTNLADRALDCAGDWLTGCRSAVDSPRFHRGQPLHYGPLGRPQEEYVRAGRALFDQSVPNADCRSTVHRAAQRLFHCAVTDAVRTVVDVGHSPERHLDITHVSLIARAARLWYRAVQTSELLLMKTAIRANFVHFHTPVSLFYSPRRKRSV